ncbi:MAG: hypothetical protein KGP27_09935 [Hyphomicrobiales bacterium]|nr:hypothetical protein [Hyphomicrobiales bacterium]
MAAHLEPIDRTNIDRAIAMLREGFPDRCEAFWGRGLSRLLDLGWNQAAGVPIGHLLLTDNETVGVVLTPATVRRLHDGSMRRIINLSSWYVVPPHRWRALAMLRSVLKLQDAIYTDLTPTPEVRQLLEALGFRQLNRGLLVEPLPLTAALPQRTTATVTDLHDAPRDAFEPELFELLMAHRAVGCIPAALHDVDGWCPLLFKASTLRRLPAARLVYCADNRRLARSFPAVSRFLVRRGRLVLVRDAHQDEPAPRLAAFRPVGLKFAKYADGERHMFSNRTDFAGSELSILDL